MNEKTRIEKDIVMFQENISNLEKNNLKISQEQIRIVELSKQYFNDSKYYLKKEDYFTAFGCINYAHGLLDAIIKF